MPKISDDLRSTLGKQKEDYLILGTFKDTVKTEDLDKDLGFLRREYLRLFQKYRFVKDQPTNLNYIQE